MDTAMLSSPNELATYNYFMEIALEEAKKGLDEGEIPVGAILVKENKILARSHNQTEQQKSALAHAEILALQQAAQQRGRWYLVKDTTLFVTLEPCTMCAGALVLARICKVVYALPDSKSGACGSVINIVQNPQLNHRIEVVSGILKEKSLNLLQGFFQTRRHQKKLPRIGYYW